MDKLMSLEDNSDSESDEDYVPNKDPDDCDDFEANSNSSGSETEPNEDDREKLKKRKNASKIIQKVDSVEVSSEPPKKSVDEMWNEFLRDTNTKPTPSSSGYDTKSASPASESLKNEADQSVVERSKKVIITETFDFAGEEIKISKEVDSISEEPINDKPGSAQSKSFTSSKSANQPSSSSLKRPGGGGLNSVLSQIGKKQKIGTLEKSKFDWDNFKKTENLEEELSQHNRGREGFLDKQDFLQRSDFRQFELERDLRLSKRKNV